MNDARTNDLVSAWRAANHRYVRLDRRWPWIKTAARKALTEHTGLGDAELARLVDETETGGAK